MNDDQTFRPIEELQSLYGTKGITADKEAITYCAIGARAIGTYLVCLEVFILCFGWSNPA
ncbi:MAG TPA: hypothetical protein V6D14_18265 [Coleofasciculaceae cyanobacterium]